MFELPKSIKIGPFYYAVEYEQRIADEGMMGSIRLLESKIEIRPGMSKEVERLTLLHEALHGIFFHGGLKDHDEQVLDIVANGVLQLLDDNPFLKE